MSTTTIHLHAKDQPISAEAYDLDVCPNLVSTTLRLTIGKVEIVIFMPEHPDALEAAKTMALAFNSVAKPKLAEVA